MKLEKKRCAANGPLCYRLILLYGHIAPEYASGNCGAGHGPLPGTTRAHGRGCGRAQYPGCRQRGARRSRRPAHPLPASRRNGPLAGLARAGTAARPARLGAEALQPLRSASAHCGPAQGRGHGSGGEQSAARGTSRRPGRP